MEVDALLHRDAVGRGLPGGIRPRHDPGERTDVTWCSDGTAGDTKSSGVWFFFAISRSSSKGIFAKAARRIAAAAIRAIGPENPKIDSSRE